MKTQTIVMICLGLLVLSACTGRGVTGNVPAETSNEPVTIGAVLPLSGQVAAYGVSAKNSIELAVQEANANGGINGHPIKVIFEDGKCDGKAGADAANKLIGVDNVPVIIGGVCSSETLSFTSMAEQNKVVVFSPCASAPEYTNAGDYIFRDYPSDGYAGTLAAQFVEKQFGAKNAAIMYTNDDYGIGVKGAFESAFKRTGEVESFTKGETDYRTQLARIKNNAPDVIFVVAFTGDAARIAVQAKEMQMNIPLVFTDSVAKDEFLATAGSVAEGMYVLASEAAYAQSYVDSYNASFHEAPQLCGPQSYDITNILVNTMRKVGTDSTAIKDALYNVKDYPGVAWNITLDQNGDLVGAAFKVLRVENGKFVTVE
ncbi:MAG: ABC transporter substrate-binding protein [Candidatus Woesearchaeota archaeon]